MLKMCINSNCDKSTIVVKKRDVFVTISKMTFVIETEMNFMFNELHVLSSSIPSSVYIYIK